MIWGRKRRRIRELEADLAAADQKVQMYKAVNATITDQWGKSMVEISELRKKLSSESPAYPKCRMGPLEVLDIQTKSGVDFQKIGAATVLGMIAAAIGLSALFRKPIKIPLLDELPQGATFRYRVYDWEQQQESTLSEPELKNLLKEKGLI